jgi:glycosyltransferase involved in cell wall biosynthesis
MRIAHLNSRLSGGGTDDQCVKLAQGLHQLGLQVWLAGPVEREFARRAGELGVPFVGTPPEGPFKLRFVLAAARLLRRERVQVVHGHHGRDLWPTILAARLSGVRPKIVLTRHLAKSPSSWVSRRFLLSQCDALIAVSQFVARVLVQGVYEPGSPEPERRSRPPLAGDHSKIHVIHGGIDADRFRPLDATEQRRIWGLEAHHLAFGVVGGYDLPRGKGQREFLQAAIQASKQVPQARFLIIGRGTLRPVLEADIARLGLAGIAWLAPYCQDMPAAMNALDCLVHPQVGTEAFPGVLLEAFACGRPVVASALDGIPEGFAVGECGRLVRPEDTQQLAEAMVEQARRPALSLPERQALHARVAYEFSSKALADKVYRLYQQLLGGSGSAENPQTGRKHAEHSGAGLTGRRPSA